MDFPEVWTFKQKQQALKLERFPSSETVLMKLASKTPAASMVSLLLPEADTSRIEDIIESTDFYRCENFKLEDVMTRSFVDGFLSSGDFVCYRLGSSDQDQDYFISKNKLQARIHKQSLHSIQAIELCKLHPRLDNDNNNFTIDMLDPTLNLSKLSDEMNELFQESICILSWKPMSNEVCSSSVAKFFSDAGRCIKLCRNKLSSEIAYGLKFPQILPNLDEESFVEISECISMAFLGCIMEETDFSSYQLPDNCIDIGRGKVIHVKGLLQDSTILRLFIEVRKLLEANHSFPWIAVSVLPVNETVPKLFVISKTNIFQYS